MRAALVFVVLLCACAAALAEQRKDSHATRYWTESWRGWHFYEDPTIEVQPSAPQKGNPDDHTRAPELVRFERLQKRLEEYRNVAVIDPTEANVRRYMELEAKVVAQASYFADVAQRIAWATPELDMTLQGRPVNARAIEIFDRDQLEARSRTVAALASDHVLFFFFRSDCPYCHALAPTLEAFQARYGIRVVAVSVDGGGLPTFPQYRHDNGISRTLNVTQVPAVFLAQPFSGTIMPIGFGVLSESQLLERISAVVAPGADAVLPSAARRVALP
jgi:conjugal transfer pilus assembly protein TraF